MAKVILITDTHFGVGNANNIEYYHDNMELFYKNIFFPYLNEHWEEFDGIIHAGDVYHDRRKIDTFTAQRAREYFFEPLVDFLIKSNLKFDMICGNHDSYFRDSLSTTTIEEFIKILTFDKNQPRDIFRVHTKFAEIPKWNMAFVPWIVKDNEEEILSGIESTKMKYIVGHLELKGHRYSKVQIAHSGQDDAIYRRFDRVMSGHFHYKDGSYLGSPTEQTWIDVGTQKGFHVFDTETNQLEFISNPYNLYENIKLGDEPSGTHKRFFRLYREEGDDDKEVNEFVAMLNSTVAHNVQVIGATRVSESGDETIGNNQVLESIEDTPTFIRSSIEDEEVANIILDLFMRASSET